MFITELGQQGFKCDESKISFRFYANKLQFDF